MQLLLGYETLQSYKRLSYKPWYAFAEFIDNSTQSYRNNKVELDAAFEENGGILAVNISYSNGKNGNIRIEDNAYGMGKEELRNALTLGKKPDIDNERSRYGLGLKTAAFWFGDTWTIKTTRLGIGKVFTVTVDLDKILSDEKEHYEKLKKEGRGATQFIPNIPIVESVCEEGEHYTVITISSLNRSINSKTNISCVEYLQSIYRIDIEKELLYLEFQGKILDWDSAAIDHNLLRDEEGNKYKRTFNFKVNGKEVSGWAGVLKTGGRKVAGFSLIQADRVIMGFPLNYKPTMLFGDEEGGTNNLVNQRLIGELRLDGFDVSHTKDQILFADDEEEDLNAALFNELADYKKLAETHRLTLSKAEGFDFKSAIDTAFKNISSPEFKEAIFNRSVLPLEVIQKSNDEVVSRVMRLGHQEYNYVIDGLEIKVLLSDDSSPYDPYLIVRTAPEAKKLTVVINKNHPYWRMLGDKTSVFNFLLTCLYDGVSEWKAQYIAGNVEPDTIKLIKDNLLRLPLKKL